jgi:SAM-dependent methyltransferase
VADYTIERGFGVRERMDLLAAVHEPATIAVLDMVGVARDARCVDLGCGGGHVTLELARRVGPSGHVTGIDLDDELLALATTEAATRGLENVTFHVGRVEDCAEIGFDLAFSRMLLSHVGDPAAVVRRMTDAVRSGGMVIVEDVQFAGGFTEPACSAYERWVQWFCEAVRHNGGDLDIGPRLPGLLREAGLVSVGVRVDQAAFLDGRQKQLQQMSMGKIKAAVIAAGLASPEDFDAAHAELRAFTDDPTTIVAGPRMFRAWARRA